MEVRIFVPGILPHIWQTASTFPTLPRNILRVSSSPTDLAAFSANQVVAALNPARLGPL